MKEGHRSASPAANTRSITRATILASSILLFSSRALPAAELTASPSQITIDDLVSITLTLDGEFAMRNLPPIPLVNLQIVEAPSVSTEFSWINGTSSRKKVLTYRAKPLVPGAARVGPMTLEDDSGNRVVLAGVPVSVVASLTNGSTDAADTLERLDSASRERVFILAEAAPNRVVQGQQVLVTWYLYAADSVRGVHMTGSPSLSDFWVEEIPLSDPVPSEMTLNGRTVQRVPIRRAVLFPLSSGKLEIAPAEAVIGVMRPVEDPLRSFGLGGFGRFDASVTDVRRKSQSLTIDVDPTPEGLSIDAVGTYEMRCSGPATPRVGPVTMDVVVSGAGNLRSARAPHFVTTPEGSVSIQEGPTLVNRKSDQISMTRRWRYLLFPRAAGSFVVPTLAFDVWDPSLRMNRTLQCAGRALSVPDPGLAANSVSDPGPPHRRPVVWKDDRTLLMKAGAVLAGLALAGMIVFRTMKRKLRPLDRAELDEILSARESPRMMRRLLAAQAARRGMDSEKLFEASTEASERFRALNSWIDLVEKEPESHVSNAAELESRARAWLAAAGPVRP